MQHARAYGAPEGSTPNYAPPRPGVYVRPYPGPYDAPEILVTDAEKERVQRMGLLG